METYKVFLSSRAERDLDAIYTYIGRSLQEPATALAIVDSITEKILSLQTMPNRGTVLRAGLYGNKNYRRIFVKNYVIVYRVIANTQEVQIMTIRHKTQR